MLDRGQRSMASGRPPWDGLRHRAYWQLPGTVLNDVTIRRSGVADGCAVAVGVGSVRPPVAVTFCADLVSDGVGAEASGVALSPVVPRARASATPAPAARAAPVGCGAWATPSRSTVPTTSTRCPM